jgi:hypothetical protein
MPDLLEDLVARIAKRDPARSEATLQADIRQFILSANLNVDANDIVPEPQTVAMEAQLGDGTRRRIDVETGTTVIEVKKNLRVGGVLSEAKTQLGNYVATRVQQTGARYLGVLTDGHEWILFIPDPDSSGEIIQAGEPLITNGAMDTDKLRSWMGAVLFTLERVRPTPEAIRDRLGADSPSHQADHASLQALYDANREKATVDLKRQLWAKLLRTAFGSEFQDQERLFLDHTLLVLTAEAIAHAVVGFPLSGPNAVSPRDLGEGRLFSAAQIHGVVESDFFDWVLEVDGGAEFVRSLASRIAKFDWTQVEHDVLKHLYESVISAETRQALGEYYTPDWLTDRIVAKEYSKPLETRVLDASAGSGTFVFHAVRAYLQAAETVGQTVGEAVDGVVRHVYGMDIHPVAVTLARVTYLLAIGTERLSHKTRGKITIPVYLGDSIQWEQKRDLLASEDAIIVETTGDGIISGGGGILFGENLVFPTSVLADAQNFDSLVSDMADEVLKNEHKSDVAKGRLMVNPILKRYDVPNEDWPVLQETFQTMRQLNRQGRNHIWGYYVRNLIRPLWLSLPENRVDVLVGNPPWLRYSKMTGSMQKQYLRLGKERNLLNGPSGASARDLSTLFVARAVELYLKDGGRFAYVMPHGTLTRKPHHSFRSGRWNANSRTTAGLTAAFETSWELVKIQTGFPMVSSVIFGSKVGPDDAVPMPSETEYWTGSFSQPSQTWAQVDTRTAIVKGSIVQHDPDDPAPVSPYIKKFRQGALVLPRMLVCAEVADAGPLGAGAGRVAMTSRRGNLDKEPWSKLPSITAAVGTDYVFKTYLGENALPFRSTVPLNAVLPIRNRVLLNDDAISSEPDLDAWWSEAERLWEAYAKKGSVPLHERIDHMGQLSAQLVTSAKYRVVYPKSGNRLTASIVEDKTAIIDHSLYWAPVETLAEARYLEAILNANCMLKRIKPLQTLGLFGSRHFDKYPFLIAFGAFNPKDPQHQLLVNLSERAEAVAAAVDVSDAKTFQAARKLIDDALSTAGISPELETAVEALLPSVNVEALEGVSL